MERPANETGGGGRHEIPGPRPLLASRRRPGAGKIARVIWQRRWPRWFLLVGVWTLPCLYFAVQVYLQKAYENQPISLTQALTRGLVFWWLWAALSPLILRLRRTFPVARSEWLDGLLFHLPTGVIFSLAHLLLYVLLTSWLDGGVPGSVAGLLAQFQPVFLSGFAWSSLIYWTILIAGHALDYYQRYQEGLLRASRLEAQLAQAELQALKMQLHPHFLFNTLHAISALMQRDVQAADQMIARLSELLRMTLRQAGGVPEVTLQRELEFLDRYLEIEKIRFRTPSTVTTHVEPEALDAQRAEPDPPAAGRERDPARDRVRRAAGHVEVQRRARQRRRSSSRCGTTARARLRLPLPRGHRPRQHARAAASSSTASRPASRSATRPAAGSW